MSTALPAQVTADSLRDPADYVELQDDIDEATYLVNGLSRLVLKYATHPAGAAGLAAMQLGMAVTAAAKAVEGIQDAAGQYIDRVHGEVSQ